MAARGGSGGGRGGGGGGRGGSHAGGNAGAKPKRDPILDLGRYLDKQIRVKYVGGREVVGLLKGFDPLLNLVLDDTKEFLRDADGVTITDNMRDLGLVVCRGTSIMLICPADGMEEIANPFLPQE